MTCSIASSNLLMTMFILLAVLSSTLWMLIRSERSFVSIILSIFLSLISTDKIMAASASIMTIADNMINEFAGLYLNLPSHSYVRTNDDTTITTDVPGVDKKDVEIGI